jgi:hypothetical protein
VKEGHEYLQYRARLLKPVVWVMPSRLWRKWVRVARWTSYDREWLVREFGESFWPVECRLGALNSRFEIQGRDGDEEEWEPVSQWRRDELRKADDLAAALASRRGKTVLLDDSGERGRRLGSGIDTLVRHLRDKTGVRSYHEILAVLRSCNVEWIVKTMSGWGENAVERVRDAYARGKEAHKEACEFCDSGLPVEIEEALARRKRH